MMVVGTVLLWLYNREYLTAVCFGMFILVAAPETIAISIDSTLPVITIHRVVVGVMFLKCMGRRTIASTFRKAAFWRILLLMAGSYFVSTILSAHFLISFKRYLYYLTETLGTFWIIYTSIQSREDASRLFKSIGLAFTLVSVIAIFERYLDFKIHDLFPRDFDAARFFWTSGNNADITSTYSHRILLGYACALGALIHLLSGAENLNPRISSYSLIQAIVCLAALYFSGSRGPWLGFLFGWALMVVMVKGKAMKWVIVIGSLILLVFIIRPGVWGTISELAWSTLEPESVKGSSFEWRFVVIETAIKEIQNADLFNGLFGFGGGSQILNDFGKHEIYPGIWLPIESWDCEYAIILYERGMIGLALNIFLAVYVLTINGLGIRARENKEIDPLRVYCFLGLAVVIFAKTNVAFFAPQLVYVEASLLAVSSRIVAQLYV